MENVDGYRVEREGNQIHISFFDIFGIGEEYVFPLDDARRIRDALNAALGWENNIASWEGEGGSYLNDSC